jgi:uncharacterized protein (DUF2147 family)
MKKAIIYSLTLFFFSVSITKVATAQKDQLEKIWYNEKKTSKIQIYLAKDGAYYGKVVWLDQPNDKDTGKPKLDKENPDEKLRSEPVMGLLIMRGFKKSSDNANEYADGTIYDPKNGKTYCGKISFKGNTLELHGFICSVKFLGRSETWTLAEGQ